MTVNKMMGCAWTLAWVMALAATLAAAGPLPVGSLVGSRHATLDGQVPLPHTTVLSGDRLHVNDGLGMVTLERGNRIILGRKSEATFLREAGAVKISLARGSLSLYHPQSGGEFRVEAGGVSVVPVRGSKTLAEIAMAGEVLAVTSKAGTLCVEVSGITKEVRQGATVTINMAAAHAAGPGPSGKPHPKRIFSHKMVLNSALLGMGAAAVASLALTRSSNQSSPITPSP